MSALEPGARFPEVSFRDEKGAAITRPIGETLYVVFKTTCPTCELTWPYLERLRQSAGPSGLRILAVSQDDPTKTEAFNRRLGSSVETIYDPQPWTASNRLGVSTVPTFFRVAADGTLAETADGFSRERLENLARRAATLAGKPYEKIFRPSDQAPATKPG